MEVKRRIEDPIGFEWSKANVLEITPAVGYVDTVVGNTNLIVHHLLEKQATRYPVLLTLFRKANSAVVVSLRSRNGEALKVAERLQGGGHANACGATLPRSVKNIPGALGLPPRRRWTRRRKRTRRSTAWRDCSPASRPSGRGRSQAEVGPELGRGESHIDKERPEIPVARADFVEPHLIDNLLERVQPDGPSG